MSKSYPDLIPEPYNISEYVFGNSEYLNDAYKRGWNHGHGLACHNVPTLGECLWTDDMGRVTVDAENIREVHASNCHAAAENSRSYSPFEFTASKFNSHSDGGWFVLPYSERAQGPFETKKEAEVESDGDEVAELPSSEEMWEAFECGTCDSIAADLAKYDDESYGIESDETADDNEEEEV